MSGTVKVEGGFLGRSIGKIAMNILVMLIVLNVVVGIVGAMMAGFLLTPFLGGAPITKGALDMHTVPCRSSARLYCSLLSISSAEVRSANDPNRSI
jgi:uncharacterized membrane protein YeaQ/YmgE (transglycosylase-associated protein family)